MNLTARLGLVALGAGGALLTNALSGAALAATPPTLTSLTFSAPGGSLYYPEGVATNNNGTTYVSNTNDNVVATISGTTVAGSYEGNGESGDGGPATAATLENPGGLATDATGDLFIADTEDNVVREVLTSGNIVLIAGDGVNGVEGYSGDGGKAINATLNNPQSVAVDSAGDVFIADTYNDVIRKVTPAGIITTVAGTGKPGYSGDLGAATSAALTQPSGVAIDALGNLYIADSGNSVIRRVDSNGTITTVAGNYAADAANGGKGAFSGDNGPATSARLNSPQGVALDRAGDLFIADTFNNAIREVTPAGIISTLVNSTAAKGNTVGSTAAASTLSGPYAVAVDNSTGNVFVADTSNNKVKQVSGLAVPGAAAGGPVAAAAAAASLPEAPLAVSLPVAALAVVGGFSVRRRRSSRRAATA